VVFLIHGDDSRRPRGDRPADAAGTRYPEGLRWLDGANDLWASITLARQGALGPLAWLKSFSRTSCFAFFDPGDPLPFLWETAQIPPLLLGYARRRFKRPQGGLAAGHWKGNSHVDPS